MTTILVTSVDTYTPTAPVEVECEHYLCHEDSAPHGARTCVNAFDFCCGCCGPDYTHNRHGEC